jgi:hypothetical protein
MAGFFMRGRSLLGSFVKDSSSRRYYAFFCNKCNIAGCEAIVGAHSPGLKDSDAAKPL